MKKFAILSMIIVLTACTMTACRFGSSDETAATVPQTTQMRPASQPTIPATTGNHPSGTTGDGVVEDMIDDVTGRGRIRRPIH